MGLWMFFTDAHDDEIEQACAAAELVFKERGITPAVASDAYLAANNLPEDYQEETTPAADAVVAWYAAEDAALQKLLEVTGEWHHQAALIYTESSDGNED